MERVKKKASRVTVVVALLSSKSDRDTLYPVGVDNINVHSVVYDVLPVAAR